MDDEMLWTVRVGWTNTRPVLVDEHETLVRVMAPTESEALLTAHDVVFSRPGGFPWGGQCEMVTSLEVLEVEL